ncbi:MAG: hypothetical protein WCP74_11960 [Sphingobacteriia bacterium]|jgi:hypothetical protein
MRYFFFLVILDFCFIQVKSQDLDLKDSYNFVLSARKSTIAEKKDVYFSKDYLPAKLYSLNGIINAKNVYKLNLETGTLYYLDKVSGDEMEVINQLKLIEFALPESKVVQFEKGFPSIETFNEKTFFQVLVNGKAKLLMATKFEEVAKTKYGAAPEKTLEKELCYFGFANGQILRITKPEHILSICSDKSKEVQDFMQNEKLKVKKTSDLEKIIKYYNGLF